MATIHLLHGFTGAGKTTFAKKLETEIGAIRFTPDEWMVKLYGVNPPEEKFANYIARIEDLIWQLTSQVLLLEKDVILDFGFWERASRDEAREKAKTLNADTKLYFISTSEQLMRHRVLQRTKDLPEGALVIDENAFELFKSRFEPLGEDEKHVTILTDE